MLARHIRRDPVGGYAKPGHDQQPIDQHPRAAHEKICSDLAFDLGLPIPPCVLWAPTTAPIANGSARLSVSLLAFTRPNKWSTVLTKPETTGRILPQVAPIAAAMAAFNTWVGNTDHDNGGNVLATEDTSEAQVVVRVAYIDYANALSMKFGADPAAPENWTTRSVVRPYPRVDPYRPGMPDLATMAAVVQRIEALPDPTITEIVERIPAAFITDGRRRTTVLGLLHRKTVLREWMRAEYPELP